ncbi:rifin PIR protein, putative [Plasmodium reichenowi]|uniref:Rifin PIR protein, putative n=1 Tax=Plasmodium reichenowi TaxID=5854 RepID=A0A2P9DSW8_PLARE|nr:rifin PIR protein, putative [Plasmodium reichenowi]
MKVHYINILLFALPLNILVKDQSNYNTPKRTPNSQLTKSHRSLCECELYAPANYDNDQEMKEVMNNFNKQTQQRFHEYDERMKTTRQKCKDKCDKEIQKIILKDKLEKELMDKFATLHTDIQSDAIPTCVCEKSLADKVEKGCLRCGYGLGTVAPTVGLIGSVAVNVWKTGASLAAAQKGIEEGVKWGFESLRDLHGLSGLIEVSKIKNLINSANYDNGMIYVSFVEDAYNTKCAAGLNGTATFCKAAGHQGIQKVSAQVAKFADDAVYMAKLTETEALKSAESALATYSNAIIASVIAIVVIVLIMVIIYLILRHRRKKKMKKKLQYIKLLEE